MIKIQRFWQLAKSCYFSKIFDPASFLPARSLPAAALLALRRRPSAYGIRHTVAAMPRCATCTTVSSAF
ncbi:MAG: hypothetical protein ACR2L2_00525 [Acidobacteriota bacterium]